MYAKELYPMLFSKKWPNSEDFLDAIQKTSHPMWGAGGAARTFSYEILMNTNSGNWRWLGERLDDFSGLVEENMIKKIHRMRWLGYLEVNAMSKHIDSTYDLTIFLMDRHTASLKNILDPRYKNHINLELLSNEGLYHELFQKKENYKT